MRPHKYLPKHGRASVVEGGSRRHKQEGDAVKEFLSRWDWLASDTVSTKSTAPPAAPS